jgi:hypothetical protein
MYIVSLYAFVTSDGEEYQLTQTIVKQRVQMFSLHFQSDILSSFGHYRCSSVWIKSGMKLANCLLSINRSAQIVICLPLIGTRGGLISLVCHRRRLSTGSWRRGSSLTFDSVANRTDISFSSLIAHLN